MIKTSFTIFILAVFPLLLWSKVDPPNYNFSLDAFEIFKPGSTLENIKKKYPKYEIVDQNPESMVIKIYVTHLRYRFPVFVQIFQEQSVDFMARLPSYFLHDLFHQSLINRYGKQNSYIKKEESALYIWNGTKDNIKRIYNGTCTITCFPVYYAEISLTPPKEFGRYKSLLTQFDEALFEKLPEEVKPTPIHKATPNAVLPSSSSEKK